MRLVTTIFKMILPVLAITAAAVFVVSAQAAPLSAPTTSGGLFAGTFEGYLTGDNNSRAPITIDLTQNGRTVTGEISIGRGLQVDGGTCGVAAVPAGSQAAAGQVSSRDARHIDATAAFKVQGLNIKIDLDGDLSRDGQMLDTEARIDLPWLCGRDPIISGVLERTS